jgi:hypothetical protein
MSDENKQKIIELFTSIAKEVAANDENVDFYCIQDFVDMFNYESAYKAMANGTFAKKFESLQSSSSSPS